MTTSDIRNCFEKARMQAARGNLVVIRSDGECLLLPPLAKSLVKPDMVAAIERMIPSTKKCKVAVIGDTSWAASSAPTLQIANQAIPFFGLLMGISTIGHAVWVFNETSNLLSAGCQDSDILIVDSASLAALPSNWEIEAKKVMSDSQILVHDRATHQLRSHRPESVQRGPN